MMDFSTIENIVRDFQYAYMSNIADTGHSASGKLGLDSKYAIDWDGRYFTVTLKLEDYWKYLEYGTKPHFPPVEAIRKWIEIKPVLPRPLPSGKLPTTKQLAFLISRKISIKGTEPTNLLEDTKNDFNIVGKVYNEFCRIWKQEINKQIEEELS